MDSNIDILNVSITNSKSKLIDPIILDIKFESKVSINNAKWKVVLEIDTAYNKIKRTLFIGDIVNYNQGVNNCTINVDNIDLSDINEHQLVNVSLLKVVLEAMDVESPPHTEFVCVTQITKPTFTSPLHRLIFAPF